MYEVCNIVEEVEGERKFCRVRGFIYFGVGRFVVGVERVIYGYFFENS